MPLRPASTRPGREALPVSAGPAAMARSPPGVYPDRTSGGGIIAYSGRRRQPRSGALSKAVQPAIYISRQQAWRTSRPFRSQTSGQPRRSLPRLPQSLRISSSQRCLPMRRCPPMRRCLPMHLWPPMPRCLLEHRLLQAAGPAIAVEGRRRRRSRPQQHCPPRHRRHRPPPHRDHRGRRLPFSTPRCRRPCRPARRLPRYHPCPKCGGERPDLGLLPRIHHLERWGSSLWQ